jgi:hypothetical protein
MATTATPIHHPMPLDPENELASDHFPLPAWIDQGLTLRDMEDIQQGGCASGAYMPAVIYSDALATMARHGDEVLEYLADHDADMTPPEGGSWSGLACHYLSMAVEIWAGALDMRQLERERERDMESWEDDIGSQGRPDDHSARTDVCPDCPDCPDCPTPA